MLSHTHTHLEVWVEGLRCAHVWLVHYAIGTVKDRENLNLRTCPDFFFFEVRFSEGDFLPLQRIDHHFYRAENTTYPTTNSGMQKGSSVGIYTVHLAYTFLHVWLRFVLCSVGAY